MNRPKLLSGGNPQIPKGEGNGPVRDYIAAMPGWKREVGKRLDDLIVRAVPDVHKAVKWNQPFYGHKGEGWFLSFRCYTNYVQLQFLKGASLDPMPPKASKHKEVRYLDLREDDELDEDQLRSWIEQASRLPGEFMRQQGGDRTATVIAAETMGAMKLPVMPPVSPMLSKSVRSIPPDASYEPKWDGFRSICFRDGDEVELGSRNERPMTRYFPELVAAVLNELPRRCVVDGEIVIATEHGLDFEALQQRIHPADSRVRMLAEHTPSSFIAFDLLALGDDDYTGRPFSERRAALVDALAGSGPSVHVTPATTDLGTAQRWFDEFEGAGLDGIIAKPLTITYQPDKRVMFKIKHERTADCVVAGYRVHKSGDDAIGSLLLGLYKDDGTLASVGVIGAFPMAKRRELFSELQSLITTFDEHPWNWAAHMAGERTPRRNEGSRWNAGKDLSFVPLRPERVVEVRYDHMEGQRFRHTAQFSRWRPDRDPRSCTYEQLEQPVTFKLGDIVPGLG